MELAAIIAAIGGLAAFVTAIGTIIVSWRNARQADRAAISAAVAADRAEETKRLAAEQAEHAKRELIVIGDAVVEVGKQVDGRLTKLLDAETRAARAEGKAEGIAEEQARTAKVIANIGSAPVTAIEALSAAQAGVPIPVELRAPVPVDVRVIQDPGDAAVRVKPEAHE